MRTLRAMTLLAFSVALLGASQAEAKGRIANAVRHPVQSLRNAKQSFTVRKEALTLRVKGSKPVQAWQRFGENHPTAKKWVKRGAIGVGVVAAVAAAPYALGAAGTVLTGTGNVLSAIGGSGVVHGASALAGKAIVGTAGVAAAGTKAAAGFALTNAVPLAAGAGGAAFYGRYKARRAVAAMQSAQAPRPPAQPVQLALPGIAAGLD